MTTNLKVFFSLKMFKKISFKKARDKKNLITDERITTIYGWVRLFYCLKKLPPLLTTQISLRSFASFAGG